MLERVPFRFFARFLIASLPDRAEGFFSLMRPIADFQQHPTWRLPSPLLLERSLLSTFFRSPSFFFFPSTICGTAREGSCALGLNSPAPGRCSCRSDPPCDAPFMAPATVVGRGHQFPLVLYFTRKPPRSTYAAVQVASGGPAS